MMQLLRTQAQIAWTGLYLAPALSHSDTGWMQKRPFLNGLGFGFAPLYVGQQQPPGPGSHILTANQGQLDAHNAVQLAQQAGFPASSVLYLDIETGPPARPGFFEYYKAWVQGVIATGFSAGVYCSHSLAAQFVAKDNRVVPDAKRFAEFAQKFEKILCITQERWSDNKGIKKRGERQGMGSSLES